MRRFTILLLAFALCACFTACSDEKAESGKNEDNASVGVTDPGKDTANAATPVDNKDKPDTTSDEGKPSDQEASQNTTDDIASDKTQESQNQTGSPASGQTTQQSAPQQSESQDATSTQPQSHPNQSQAAVTPTPEPEVIQEPQPTPEPQPVTEPEPQPVPEPAAPTLEQAGSYVGSSASALEGALGSPVSKEYSPSCMGEGEDGMWIYDGFTVYTYRENGVETVEAVR